MTGTSQSRSTDAPDGTDLGVPEVSATSFSSSLLAPLATVSVMLELHGTGGEVRLRQGKASSAEFPAPDGNHVLTDRFRLAIAGSEYDLSLSVDLTEQLRLAQDLVARAYYDDLTGLPNRALIERSVQTLIDSDAAPFALAFIDLDGFKRTNDYYGHGIGDQLLARIAERLTSKLRSTDMLARLGGDELLLLLTPIADAEDLACDLRWLLERLQEPFYIDGHEILTSASIGVALYPRDGRSYHVLRMNADRAMYSSKTGTKGAIRFFDAAIAGAAAERHQLEQRIRRAVHEDRIRCAYQPKLNFREQRIAGVEVLMRWIDEDGLVQPPGQALQIASEVGMMDDITHRVLEQTIASIDEINEAFGRETSISLNVSPRQSADLEFMRGFVNALDRTGFADRFMLELTEEAFLAHHDFQKYILPLIRSVGARVSIDDFGVGYSSLSSLAAITADEVKVDRSFITNVQSRVRSQSILKAVEALGNSLGMSVVVEGVETEDELAYLRSETGISIAQGYRFSKPVMLDTGAALAGGRWQGRALCPTRGMRSSRLALPRMR